MQTEPESFYFTALAAACVRGFSNASAAIEPRLLDAPLDALTPDDCARLVECGREAGLRLHRFKRTMELPRVRRILGALRSMRPATLLDIGFGRGAFLWPLLDAFPDLNVSAIDRESSRGGDATAVRRGGVTRLSPLCMDVCALGFEDRSFDAITALEVLEHLPDPRLAIREIVRVARRFILITVPSRPDDNPEHLHLLRPALLEEMLAEAGAPGASFEEVRGHTGAGAKRRH